MKTYKRSTTLYHSEETLIPSTNYLKTPRKITNVSEPDHADLHEFRLARKKSFEADSKPEPAWEKISPHHPSQMIKSAIFFKEDSQVGQSHIGQLQNKSLTRNKSNYEKKRLSLQSSMKFLQSSLASKGAEVFYSKTVIPRNSPFMFFWNVLIICCVISDLIIIPYELSNIQEQNMGGSSVILLTIVQICYIIDLHIGFRVTRTDSQVKEIVDPPSLGLKYFNSIDFFYDLMSASPVLAYFKIFFNEKGMHDLFLLVRLLKLCKFKKIWLDLNQFIFVPGWVRFTGNFIALITMIHIESCIWIALISRRFLKMEYSLLQQKNIQNTAEIEFEEGEFNPLEQLWLPPVYRSIESENLVLLYYKSNFWHKYLYTFYSLFLAIGGNEVGPTNGEESLFATFYMLLGLILTGMIMSQIAESIEDMNSEKTEYNRLIDKTQLELEKNKISYDLRQKIMVYLDYAYKKDLLLNNEEEEEDFSSLPPGLRRDTQLYINKSLIMNVSIFNELESNEIYQVIKRLKTWVYMPGDQIIRKGEVGNEMFFIKEGTVEVLISGHWTQRTPEQKSILLGPGNFFGELALINNSKRTASINARDFCILEILDRESFDELQEQNPALKKKLQRGMKMMVNKDIISLGGKLEKMRFFRKLQRHEMLFLIRNYVDIIFVDPDTILTKPQGSCNAIYFILVGSVSRYANTKKNLRMIQNRCSKHGILRKNRYFMSLNQKFMDRAQLVHLQNIEPDQKLVRDCFFGNLPLHKERENPFFDVSDSSLQLAVITVKELKELQMDDKELFVKLQESYLEDIVPILTKNNEFFNKKKTDYKIQTDRLELPQEAQLTERLLAIDRKIKTRLNLSDHEEKLKSFDTNSLEEDEIESFIGLDRSEDSNPNDRMFFKSYSVSPEERQQPGSDFVRRRWIEEDMVAPRIICTDEDESSGFKE